MVANDLRNQCKSQATSVGLGSDERIKQDRQEVRRDARAVVLDDDLERQRMRWLTPCTAMRMPGRKAVVIRISALECAQGLLPVFTRLRKTWMSWSRLP